MLRLRAVRFELALASCVVSAAASATTLRWPESTVMPGVVDNDHNLVFDVGFNGFTPGPGTSFADPAFVGGGNSHLRNISPARDAGNPARVPVDLTADLDGNPRQDGIVDIGADESWMIGLCESLPGESPAGEAPEPLAAGDFDNDGIRDLVVCSGTAPVATVLRGNGVAGQGDGIFGVVQNLPLVTLGKGAVVADFNADGRQDIAVSMSDPTTFPGFVSVWLNDNGLFPTATSIALLGRSDGIASADVDQDGITDLVVCLQDSAGIQSRGGVQILRGAGTGGVGSGAFLNGPKFPTGGSFSNVSASRVLVRDFNQDGVQDIAFTGSRFLYVLRFNPGLTLACMEILFGDDLSPQRIVSGDLNSDGRLDVVVAEGHQAGVCLKTAAVNAACGGGFWFSPPDPDSLITMSGPVRDIAALDFDQDGILDLVTALQNGALEFRRGLGTAGAGNGKFAGPIGLSLSDASDLVVGDFVTNGSPDLALSRPSFNSVWVLANFCPPELPTFLTLSTPNGGEVWPQGVATQTTSASAIEPPCDVTPAAAGAWRAVVVPAAGDTSRPEGLPRTASLQQITWTKGAGVRSVDVEISRDDGVTWQRIGTDNPGTSMTWIVTPPGTPGARMRVLDTAVTQRSDASDAAFLIPGGPTDVAADPRAPRLAAFGPADRVPARDVVRFRMDVPAPSDVDVNVYDVRGRWVRNVMRDRFSSGRHVVAWDMRDAHATHVACGVYLVRARIGAFRADRKVVVVR
jgi:hypothetical protein